MTQEALKLALEYGSFPQGSGIIRALREALAQPEQEPVALVIDGVLVKSELPEKYTGHLYTQPPQRTWVGLTNDEVNNFAAGCHLGNSVQDAIYKAVAKLKEKNT